MAPMPRAWNEKLSKFLLLESVLLEIIRRNLERLNDIIDVEKQVHGN